MLFSPSKIIFILLFCLLARYSIALGKADSTNTITSLSGKWLIYSNEYSGFVPYTPKISNFTTNISIWIDARHFRQYLQFSATDNLCLYANNKLFFRFNKAETKCISISYLKQELQAEKIFLTFYQPKGILPFNNASIVSSPSVVKKTLVQSNLEKQGPIEKPAKKLDEISLIVFTLIAAIYIALKNLAPFNFLPIFDFSGYAEKEVDRYNSNSFRVGNAFTVILLSTNVFCISYLTYMLIRNTDIPHFISSFLYFNNLAAGRTLVILNLVMFGVLYLASKYILVQGMGSIFNLSRLSPMHYYELVRFSTLLSISGIFLGLLCFAAHIIEPYQMIYAIEILVALFFLVRCIKVSMLLTNWAKFRTVYLFSYLCATEILPIMVVMHIVLTYHGLAGSIE